MLYAPVGEEVKSGEVKTLDHICTDKHELLERRGGWHWLLLFFLVAERYLASLCAELYFALWDNLYELRYVAEVTVVRFTWDDWFSLNYREAGAAVSVSDILGGPEALVRDSITECWER